MLLIVMMPHNESLPLLQDKHQ